MKPIVAVRFKRPWQGRAAGDIDNKLPQGVMATLIDYGFAERVEEPKPRRRRQSELRVEDEHIEA